MTLQEYLAAEGLTAEEIAAIVGNEKQAKAMTKALGLAEEGKTLKAQAEAEKAETATFWEQKTSELQSGVNRLTAAEKRAATAEAEAARRTAYLKSLKDQGYDVPDDMIGASAHEPEPPKYATIDDVRKGVRQTAPDLVTLTALSNEYMWLFGKPYTTINDDFAEAQKAGKPLAEFARTKHNFAAKQAEKSQAEAEAAYQARFKDDIAKEQAKWAETHGSNSETRTPMPSKWDKLEKQAGFKPDSWKSPEGRAANRAERLKRFENVRIQ